LRIDSGDPSEIFDNSAVDMSGDTASHSRGRISGDDESRRSRSTCSTRSFSERRAAWLLILR